jgi:transcriptional regulator with XRE-family HTH domain
MISSCKHLAFGDLLRYHRMNAGLTQEVLAERAGLSLRGLSDLERGVRRAPYRDTVLRLAEALGLADAEIVVLLTKRRRGGATRIPPALSATWMIADDGTTCCF